MKREIWVVIVLLFATLAVAGPVVIIRENVGGDDAAEAADDRVVMERLQFEPKSIGVRPGTELVFENKDVAPHTVTADDGSIDSGILNPGKAFRVAVDKAFEYHCEIHPSMKAKVVVEA